MLKKILKIFRKVILTCFLLYGYNLIASPIGIIIPINVITVTLITLFGLPALCGLITIFLLVF